MAKVRKATPEEAVTYRATTPVYPLYGFINVDRVQCAVEYLGEGPGEPNYEVMAPEGFHFDDEGLHTLLCTTLQDCSNVASGQRLEACTERCR